MKESSKHLSPEPMSLSTLPPTSESGVSTSVKHRPLWHPRMGGRLCQLSRSDVDINLRDAFDRTAIFAASENGKEEIVKLLLSRSNVDINLQDAFRQSALVAVSRNRQEGIVKLLLSRSDVEINLQAVYGETALFVASMIGHEGIVKLILSRDDVAVNTTTDRIWGRIVVKQRSSWHPRMGIKELSNYYFLEAMSISTFKMRMMKLHSLRRPRMGGKKSSNFYFSK